MYFIVIFFAFHSHVFFYFFSLSIFLILFYSFSSPPREMMRQPPLLQVKIIEILFFSEQLTVFHCVFNFATWFSSLLDPALHFYTCILFLIPRFSSDYICPGTTSCSDRVIHHPSLLTRFTPKTQLAKNVFLPKIFKFTSQSHRLNYFKI